MSETNCYCNKLDYEILSDILNNSIPRDALVKDCCWKKICQVRGKNFGNVEQSGNWSDICSDRGFYKFGH